MKKKHCERKVEMKQIKKVSLIGLLVLFISNASLVFAESWLVEFSIQDDNSNEYVTRDQQMQVFCDSSYQVKNTAISALGFGSNGTKTLKDKRKLRFILGKSDSLYDRENAIYSPSSQITDWVFVYFILNLETYEIEESWGKIQVRAMNALQAYNKTKAELGYNSSGIKNIGGMKVKLLPRAIYRE